MIPGMVFAILLQEQGVVVEMAVVDPVFRLVGL